MSTLLLESFLVPPSFIPSSPRPTTPTLNPPPSRPPSAPLPPVPGPSRISESDALLFLGSTRNSKYSGAGRPDSIASVASAKSNGVHYAHSPNYPKNRRDSDSHSNRSGFSRVSGRSSTDGRPLWETSSVIRESRIEDGDDVSIFDPADAYGGTMDSDSGDEQLTKMRMTISPMPPDYDHDNRISPPLSAQFPIPPPLSKDHISLANKRLSLSSSISSSSLSKRPQFIRKDSVPQHQTIHSVESIDSISSISMHDLPPDDSAGSSDEFDVPTTTKFPAPPRIDYPPAVRRTQQLAPISSFPQTLQPHSSSLLQTPRSPNIPTTPMISETPPTPQSPEYDTSIQSASIATTVQRPRGRFSSTAATPSSFEPPLSSSSPSHASTPSSSSQDASQPVEFPSEPVASPTAEELDSDPLRLHRELRSRRSRSASHKRRLQDTDSGSGSASPALGSGESTPALPTSASGSSTPSVFEPSESVFGFDDKNIPEQGIESLTLNGLADSRTRGNWMSGSSEAAPPSSFRASASMVEDGRGSPDIQDLLEKTPRPRRKSSASRLSSSASMSSLGTSAKRSRSASRSRKRKSTGSSVDARRRASEGIPGVSGSKKGYRESFIKREQERDERLARLERELEGMGSDEESDDGRVTSGYGFGYDVRSISGSEGEDGLLPGEDGSASDSSLDIHTPLPHLLLRHGLLSHKSKLIPSNSLGSLPSTDSLASVSLPGERPASTMSMQSTDSKASLLKDVRDTPSRRLRHKDGRLLRGGLGLTTGLGWSDSEDEDAPSPLTSKLSGMLSRKASFASLSNGRPSSSASAPSRSKSYGNLRSSSEFSTNTPSQRSSRLSSNSSYSQHPLSRSYSSNTLLEADERNDSEDEYVNDTFHGYPAANRSMPPSSWQGSVLKGRKAGTSRTSTGSNSSLAISIPDSRSGIITPTANGFKTITRSISEASLSSNRSIPYPAPEEILKTPSSSSSMSSVSIAMPTTPRDEEADTATPLASLTRIDPNKILPPLPNPRTGSIRRPVAPGLAARFASPKTAPTSRSRSNSVGTSESPATNTSNIPTMPSTTPSHLPPRQLQLPRYTAATAGGQARTATRSTPTTPVATSRPTPRTGTGMVYRSSSGGARTSMMKMPSSTILRTSASEGRI
ncbi:60s acidic ribosomal protein [Moniliophthora roreri MCA 2997]|uniref:60s acidic ribosomal protein n=1 Tax=Moniliophthora roreri (strain MCA 2997) TaxID=1381753 RepID=V2XCE7_MONRO|nr:60s acidic ribosomal protein [Moniliophthora roreri MCA 2997]KAI3618250.1 60s acidic ribosomal protein [Moniliophthora roreri]